MGRKIEVGDKSVSHALVAQPIFPRVTFVCSDQPDIPNQSSPSTCGTLGSHMTMH